MRLSRRMNDDLSDGLAAELSQNPCICCKGCFCQGWAECRRRAEAQIEERVKCAKLDAFAEGYQAAMAEAEVQVEQARTEAFEAGLDARKRMVKVRDTDEAYRAWREGK